MINKELSPYYQNKPIAHVSSLFLLLGTDHKKISKIIKNINRLYRKNKPDDKGRITFTVLEPLNTIQKKINQKILAKVNYPPYLHGFIKGKSILTNACMHEKPKTLISLDIKKFYDNCREEIIFNIWKNFFNFHDEVAQLLTKLTIFDNCLPQGASTSPLLSNLVFWETESKLVEKLLRSELEYSRYADDMSISSKKLLSNKSKTALISTVAS